MSGPKLFYVGGYWSPVMRPVDPTCPCRRLACVPNTACTGDVQIHLNFCIPHTHCQLLYGFTYTVEPLYIGHHWDPAGCPVKRGVPNSELDLYTALCHWECGHFSLERCSSFRLPFIERFHCTTTQTLSATVPPHKHCQLLYHHTNTVSYSTNVLAYTTKEDHSKLPKCLVFQKPCLVACTEVPQ